MQLIGEFKRLGSTIVYADFSKIVVCTKKKCVEDASAYIEFILGSIRSRDLFHSIQIEPTACWSYLFWMDQVSSTVKYLAAIKDIHSTKFGKHFECPCS